MKDIKLFNVVASLLIILFSYTAISKLIAQERFVYQMQQSPWQFLAQHAVLVSWLLPIVELGIVVLYFIPRLKKMALLFSFMLLLVFEIYISFMLLNNSHLPCSCGGIVNQLSWKGHLAFNAFFMLMILIVLLPKNLFSVLLSHVSGNANR